MKKGIIVIILIVAAVFSFYGIRYAKTPVSKQEATIVTVEESVHGEAYIVKKENVYKAQNTGTFYSYKSDGERVAKNSRIASVYNGSVNADILAELNSVNKKIEVMREKSKESNLFVSDSNNAESNVDTIKNKIISDMQSHDASRMKDYKADIIKTISGDESASNAQLTELEAKAERLQSSIGTQYSDIYSDMAGVYTENIDGMESILTPESVMTYTVSQFDELEEPPEYAKKMSAELGEDICKVIDNHTWYIMMKAQTSKIENLKAGQRVSIGFESITDDIAQAKVVYISPEEDGHNIIVISCDRYVDGILTMRKTDIRLIIKSYTGYKIPIYALRVRGDKKGVMIEKEGLEVFRECEILYTDDSAGFVIIYPAKDVKDPLEPMDHIIIGEKY